MAGLLRDCRGTSGRGGMSIGGVVIDAAEEALVAEVTSILSRAEGAVGEEACADGQAVLSAAASAIGAVTFVTRCVWGV